MKNKLWIALLTIFLSGIFLCGCSVSKDDIIGDWYGVSEVHSDYNEGTFEAILSINPDGQWASCVNGKVNRGTWEFASESSDCINLTVEYEGTDLTNTWSFEKRNGKYYYDFVYLEAIPIEMSKLKNESKEEMFGEWEGKILHTFEGAEEMEFEASLSINADNSWSSSVSGSDDSGHWSYISEAGHLIVLTVEYEGIDATNSWAFVKSADGQYYYEYVYMEAIRIPVAKQQ